MSAQLYLGLATDEIEDRHCQAQSNRSPAPSNFNFNMHRPST